MQTPDVVVLVPGFLGFTRFGRFYYFADRLVAVLRGLLEEPLGYPVPVVPVTTLPTDSLGNRQGALLQNLEGVREQLSGVERIHLIGHSTGGVDAQLLACTKSFDGHAWDKKVNAVRKEIKSVVTISAPHYGTGLADGRLARWGENPLRHPTAIIPEARTLIDLLLLIPRDLAAAAGIELAAPNDVIKFMWQVARNRDLIEDLKPERMEAVRARLSSDPEIALTCFVTGTTPRADSTRPSDPFFRDMYRLTQGSEAVSPAASDCDRFLRTLACVLGALTLALGRSCTKIPRTGLVQPFAGNRSRVRAPTAAHHCQIIGSMNPALRGPHRVARSRPCRRVLCLQPRRAQVCGSPAAAVNHLPVAEAMTVLRDRGRCRRLGCSHLSPRRDRFPASARTFPTLGQRGTAGRGRQLCTSEPSRCTARAHS